MARKAALPQPITLDWSGEDAARAKARAQTARVEEEARRNLEEFRLEASPFYQQMKANQHFLDELQVAREARGRLEEQNRMLVEMVGELRDRVDELEGRVRKFEGPVGLFRRRRAADGSEMVDAVEEVGCGCLRT